MNFSVSILAAYCCCITSLITAAPVELSNDRFRIELAGEEHGMGVRQLEDCSRGTIFWKTSVQNPLLWRIHLSEAGSDQTVLSRDNRDASECRIIEQTPDYLRIRWSGFAGLRDAEALTVDLQISLDAAGRSSWELVPELNDDRYTFTGMVFPCVENVIDPTKEKILFPVGNNGSRIVNFSLKGLYPSFEAQLQFFGFLQEQGALYMGLHDPEASIKSFELSDQLELSVFNYSMNTSIAGQSRTPSYPVIMAPAASSWECCALYRDWAEDQQWTSRGKHNERKDLPPRSEEIGLWLNLDDDPEKTTREALSEAPLQKDPCAVHWYHWNKRKFDREYPEMFPAKEGFREAVQAMRNAGMFVFPYMNGRLWDTTSDNFESVRHEACSQLDGTLIAENYGSGAWLAVMCPTSATYARKLYDNVATAINEYGLNGIYLDQIASCAPVRCCNPDHGHPISGGGWWQQNYRSLMKPIIDDFGSKAVFLTENGAEPYIDSFNTFLLWVQVYTDDFPSLIAVYNQYAWYMCSMVVPEDDLQSFAGLISRCLLWNIQPGWLNWLHGTDTDLSEVPDAAIKRDYIDRVLQLRHAAAEVVRDGIPFGDVIFTPAAELITLRYHRNTNYGRVPVTPGEFPSYYGTWWQAEKGDKWVALLAELSGHEQSSAFVALPPGFEKDAAGKAVYRIFEDGRKEQVEIENGVIPVKFVPFDLQCYIIE
ncbi:DUF6259 domain-containing protein [Victivallis sp. Marseille-Q1083]|uniref:DUF6259 domain-containing protein n=1 Tax=Victivallis sp. Marseille-Q1083 TaxID=2717288 RepID=UPI00158AE576|nr:DUF6259 domain-containing protein [Victivallis sp. Marseille-Q1083]